MDGKARRQEIIHRLESSTQPLSGSMLAKQLGVSRQVIVQDIALLRTQHSILATAQGYLLYVAPGRGHQRAFLVRHDSQQIADELSAIVALGGRILDVIVEHDVYGQLQADLNLSSLRDVELFCQRLQNSNCGPLFPISAGVHFHTVEAQSEEILDQIEETLNAKGYLLSPHTEE